MKKAEPERSRECLTARREAVADPSAASTRLADARQVCSTSGTQSSRAEPCASIVGEILQIKHTKVGVKAEHLECEPIWTPSEKPRRAVVDEHPGCGEHPRDDDGHDEQLRPAALEQGEAWRARGGSF